MSSARSLLPWLLAALLPAGASVAQDQKFAIRFGFNRVESTGDTNVGGIARELDSMRGGELDFEWYFHPRVGFEVASTAAASADVLIDGDVLAGVSFSTFTLGVNGHLVRSEKVDFAVGLLAGNARYADFEFFTTRATIGTERESVWGAQAFVDMTVGRKWAVNLGLKYLDAQLDPGSGPSIDHNPVILRVLGVFRWGKPKQAPVADSPGT